jgi:plastocyanin
MIGQNHGYILTSLPCSVSVVIVYTILMSPSTTFNPLTTVFAQVANNQPNINATSVFHTGQMILPGNVKHLVILIPNEGHHGPGEEDEARFIAQPFVPQNAIVSPGTEVVWFSGDVGHEHNIVVRNAAAAGTLVFETGEFPELTASRPIVFNNTGNFEYADTIEYEEGFVMTGNVTVADQNSGASTPAGISDTVGALMVPSIMVQSVTDEMRGMGFGIDSMHNFKDFRGGQEDTGDEQVLVVWTAFEKSLDEITSQLGEISGGLPYD